MPSRNAPENSRVLPCIDAAQRLSSARSSAGSSSPSTMRAIEKYGSSRRASLRPRWRTAGQSSKSRPCSCRSTRLVHRLAERGFGTPFQARCRNDLRPGAKGRACQSRSGSATRPQIRTARGLPQSDGPPPIPVSAPQAPSKAGGAKLSTSDRKRLPTARSVTILRPFLRAPC